MGGGRDRGGGGGSGCLCGVPGIRDLGQVPRFDRLVERGGAVEHPTGGSGWGRARCGEMVCTGM